MDRIGMRSVVRAQVVMLGLGLCLSGCDRGERGSARGQVQIDGSSTTQPITVAAAEMFQAEHPRVDVTVGISGTGGGFRKFLEENPKLRTDINDASRVITREERARAKRLGVEYIEAPIAMDGLAVVVNPANDWVDYLTIAELRRIWEPGSNIRTWRDVRPDWPDETIELYGPDTESGTFDYFTEAVVGEAGRSRGDYTANSSDNVLVLGVAGDKDALGYFGFAYYDRNRDKLRAVPIKDGDAEPRAPTPETINEGTYPLTRPLLLYINKAALQREAVREFVEFLYTNAGRIVEHPKVDYVALDPQIYAGVLKRIRAGETGTVLGTEQAEGKSLRELFGA